MNGNFLIILGVICGAISLFSIPYGFHLKSVDGNKKKLNVGNESVAMGDVSGNVGNGSVVIGATDSKGNTILNQPMAVGKNAYAGPGSIAIGANAGAGANPQKKKA